VSTTPPEPPAAFVEAADLAALLRMWRAGADLSIDEVSARASQLLPKSLARVGRETIRRYERGMFPASGPDSLVVYAVAMACERPGSELPDQVIADLRNMADLLSRP